LTTGYAVGTDETLKVATKVSLWALALTLTFFGLAAIFMKMGPCGPTSDASAIFFIILLPAIYLVDILKTENSVIAWSLMAMWIYFVSWFAVVCTVALLGLRRVSGRR
jgi:hypothetical protein